MFDRFESFGSSSHQHAHRAGAPGGQSLRRRERHLLLTIGVAAERDQSRGCNPGRSAHCFVVVGHGHRHERRLDAFDRNSEHDPGHANARDLSARHLNTAGRRDDLADGECLRERDQRPRRPVDRRNRISRSVEVVRDSFPAVRTQSVRPDRRGRHGIREPHAHHRRHTDHHRDDGQRGGKPARCHEDRRTSSACSRSFGYLLLISTQRPSAGCANPRDTACNHWRSRPSLSASRGSAP